MNDQRETIIPRHYCVAGYKKNEDNYCPSCKWNTYLTWYMSPPNIIKLSQTVWELWPAQDFGFRGDKYIKQELSFLHATLLLDLIYVPTKYYQIISNSMGVMACTRFWLQGRYKKESESCLSCTLHAYWSSSLSLWNMKAIHWRVKVTYNFEKRLTKRQTRMSREINT